MEPDELILSTDVSAVLAHREAIRDRIVRLLDLAHEIEDLANKGNLGVAQVCLRGKHSHAEALTLESAMLRVDVGGWQWLMTQCGLRSFLDAQAREEWNKAISTMQVPPLDRDAIVGTFSKVYAEREMMVLRGVQQQFFRLSWDYKTNSPIAFGTKFIMQHFMEVWGVGPNRHQSAHHRACDEIDDLERMLHLLEGKPEPDHRLGTAVAVREAQRNGLNEIKMPHLRIRWFKGTTAHVWFLQPAYRDSLNRLIGKVRALPHDPRST